MKGHLPNSISKNADDGIRFQKSLKFEILKYHHPSESADPFVSVWITRKGGFFSPLFSVFRWKKLATSGERWILLRVFLLNKGRRCSGRRMKIDYLATYGWIHCKLGAHTNIFLFQLVLKMYLAPFKVMPFQKTKWLNIMFAKYGKTHQDFDRRMHAEN